MDTQRFTGNLQTVLARSREISKSLDITYIGSEQVVYAMLATPECTAAKLLSSCGVKKEDYRRYLDNIIDRDCTIVGFTPRTKNTLERAIILAVEYNGEDGLAGTEHMLKAIMESHDCFAVRIFHALGVNLSLLAAKVELSLSSGGYLDDEDEDEEDESRTDER